MQERRKASGSTTIKVIGVGGAGCNAVNRMIETGLEGVEFVSMNTDDQVLDRAQCEHKVQLGEELTKGRGAGGNPQIGMEAAKESIQEVSRAVDSAAMVFITAGMGGGTGTGAAPVVAEASKQAGALTVAVVTKPFTFEGPRKQRIAEQGIAELSKQVDAVIVIPNDRLTEVADRHVTFVDAFRMADDVLRQGVQGISDIIQIAGIINVDFADVKSIMENAGTALMGIGIGTGDDRAAMAARAAISSPMLETNVNGARGVLFNISGGSDLGISEVNEAATIICDATDKENADIIFGAVIDPTLDGEVRITVLATGFAADYGRRLDPSSHKSVAAPESEPVSEQSLLQEVRTPEFIPERNEDIPTFLRKPQP